MDTSEMYIKMCERAHELQLNWKPQDGDFAYTAGDEAEGGNYSEGVRIVWNERMPLSGYHNWDDHWEEFLPIYSLSGETAQSHTDNREKATCEKCIEAYDLAHASPAPSADSE